VVTETDVLRVRENVVDNAFQDAFFVRLPIIAGQEIRVMLHEMVADGRISKQEAA
jgi:hypothetical protein